MLGLFGTLNLATRSLATQQAGTEVAGHNLANVSNPAYARQRMRIETSVTSARNSAVVVSFIRIKVSLCLTSGCPTTTTCEAALMAGFFRTPCRR